jgi:hypothetical protein
MERMSNHVAANDQNANMGDRDDGNGETREREQGKGTQEEWHTTGTVDP